MTDFKASDRDVNRAIRSWLQEDRHEDASRVAGAVLNQLDTIPQRRSQWLPAWRMPIMNRFITFGLGAAAVVVALFVGVQVLGPPGGGPGVAPTTSPEPTVTAEPSVAVHSPSTLPALPLPGNGPSRAGDYGWTGARGYTAGMHHVVVKQTGSSQTQLWFAIEDDCFAYGTDGEPESLTVAGLDARYFEPYLDPNVMFIGRGAPRGAETTGAYALPVGDRTLCVYLTWDPTTTQEQLEAARQVVESIRGQPFGPNGIRIIFTLPEGWDRG
jgi:hypothetical protein